MDIPVAVVSYMFPNNAVYMLNIWVFPKIGVPQNGWFIMENAIKIVDWGYPYFRKHPYSRYMVAYGSLGLKLSRKEAPWLWSESCGNSDALKASSSTTPGGSIVRRVSSAVMTKLGWKFPPQRIHVWYIYLHLADLYIYGKCRQICHTWILWARLLNTKNGWKWDWINVF